MPILRRTALALGCALLLAACGGSFAVFGPAEPPPPCPRLTSVRDAAQLTRFVGTGRDLTDVRFEAAVEEIGGSCVHRDDSVELTMQIRFVASRGPADRDRRAEFRYFVAVATADQEIRGRETFSAAIEFPGNQVQAATVEELEPLIMLREGETGADYVVYVGFELTPEELAFNRRQLR